MKYKLDKDEQETTINYNSVDDFAIVTTHDAVLAKSLIANKCEETICDKSFYPTLYQFRVPRSFVSIVPPKPKRTRVMTEEQRVAASERMKSLHANGKL